jgi:hypothetical protein
MLSVQVRLIWAGHGGGMQTRPDVDEPTATDRPVRTDLRAGVALLVVVIGGNLAWHASDAGLVTALAGR